MHIRNKTGKDWECVNEKYKDIWTDEDGSVIEKTSIHAWRDL